MDRSLKGSARRGVSGVFHALVAMIAEPQAHLPADVGSDAARLVDLHSERPALETLMFFDLEPADMKVLHKLVADELRAKRVARQLDERLARGRGQRRWWRKGEYESELKAFIEATEGLLSIKEQVAFVRYFESIGRFLDEVAERQEEPVSGVRYIPVSE